MKACSLHPLLVTITESVTNNRIHYLVYLFFLFFFSLSSLKKYITWHSVAHSISGREGEMGLGLNVHIKCLKSPQSWPVSKLLFLLLPSWTIDSKCQELHCSPAAISHVALLHQGLDFIIPKRQMPYLHLYQQVGVSAEPTSLFLSTQIQCQCTWLEEPTSICVTAIRSAYSTLSMTQEWRYHNMGMYSNIQRLFRGWYIFSSIKNKIKRSITSLQHEKNIYHVVIVVEKQSIP